MKALFITIALIVACTAKAQHTLSVRIDGIKKVEGEIEFCLFDSQEGYMTDAVSCEYVPVDTENLVYSFENVSPGLYAVVVVHDLNGNRNLDTNWMRIPKEPYGFSNNPSTTFGPPDFEGARFEVTGDARITIKLK